MFGALERLRARGVEVDGMVEAGMALYVPHGIDAEAAAVILKKLILRALDDPNVSSLLVGAILLEEELFGRRGEGMTGDPVFLLADEMIGSAIAEYIGGTCARFEFTRYDQKKPGILRTLGPFLDDAVAGLIAGCTSRLYSECA